MSEFDKEAEREKLREKYGDEQEDREATQQMSELLLQGATMTNKHCDRCGDPIFRHEGQEFCPTCQVEVGDDAAGSAADEGGDAEAPAGEGAETDAAQSAPPEVGEREAAAGGRGRAGGTTGAPDPRTRDRSAAESESDRESGPRTADDRQGERGTQRRSAADSGAETAGRSPAPADEGEGVHGARASLERTLARFARRAEETDDPRAAREHLSAAREAAEALAALRK